MPSPMPPARRSHLSRARTPDKPAGKRILIIGVALWVFALAYHAGPAQHVGHVHWTIPGWSGGVGIFLTLLGLLIWALEGHAEGRRGGQSLKAREAERRREAAGPFGSSREGG